MKIVVELTMAGKINPVKVEDYQTNAIAFAKALKATERAIATPATTPPAPTPPATGTATPPPDGPIKNIGELRSRISKAYPTMRTVAAQDSVLGEMKAITNFDEAFEKVNKYMDGEI